jgi:hypothetical protein
VQIDWIQCQNYDEAKNYSGVIYLHERDDKPFYWGKADNSFFGGHMRELDGLHASGRYNSGYRHWIEGCLRYGAKLYIGKPEDQARSRVDDIERYLIHRYPSVMNDRVTPPAEPLTVRHVGSVPASIPPADR